MKDIIPPQQLAKLRLLPETPLLSEISLLLGLGVGEGKKLLGKLPPIAEIDHKGRRRCVVTVNNDRCTRYEGIVCKKHSEVAMTLTNFFSSPRLKDAYEAFKNDPAKMQADSELAMMRLMLSALVERLDDNKIISLDMISGVTVLCEKITQVIERINKMEKLTPETMNRIMEEMTKIAAEYIPPDKLNDFADRIEKIEYSNTPVPKSDYVPGKIIEMKNGEQKTIQRRAMLDVAAQLGINMKGHDL